MKNVEISILLQQLFDELAMAQSPIIHDFNPGLSPTLIKQVSEKLEITFPESVFELFSWKNGLQDDETKTVGQRAILPLGSFYPFEENVRSYEYHAGTYWNIGRFPLFENGCGDYYLIDCDRTSPSNGYIYLHGYIEVEFQGPVTKYDSLESMLTSMIQCYRQKAYFFSYHKYDAFTQTPYFDFDPRLEAKISAPYNPNSRYWSIFHA